MSRLARAKRNGGYRPGSGRGKSGWYRGYWCDSSWELAWIIYHLDRGWTFSRNTEKFAYTYDGVTKNYIPDFVLPDGTFVEVKGYFTPEVRAKLAVVPGILVFGPKEMGPILGEIQSRLGKDITTVYEPRNNSPTTKPTVKRRKNVQRATQYRQPKEPKLCGCGRPIQDESRTCPPCYKHPTKIDWPTDTELRSLVWAVPIQQLATRWGVSDVAVKKRCRIRGIDTPPRGYWAKMYANNGGPSR